MSDLFVSKLLESDMSWLTDRESALIFKYKILCVLYVNGHNPVSVSGLFLNVVCQVLQASCFLLFVAPALPLSTLRLLVSPIRLVSAAIWQTVEQKIISDYGLLEEFVFMVTEIVPQLLSTKQRAELILGLRARVSCSFFNL